MSSPFVCKSHKQCKGPPWPILDLFMAWAFTHSLSSYFAVWLPKLTERVEVTRIYYTAAVYRDDRGWGRGHQQDSMCCSRDVSIEWDYYIAPVFLFIFSVPAAGRQYRHWRQPKLTGDYALLQSAVLANVRNAHAPFRIDAYGRWWVALQLRERESPATPRALVLLQGASFHRGQMTFRGWQLVVASCAVNTV